MELKDGIENGMEQLTYSIAKPDSQMKNKGKALHDYSYSLHRQKCDGRN